MYGKNINVYRNIMFLSVHYSKASLHLKISRENTI